MQERLSKGQSLGEHFLTRKVGDVFFTDVCIHTKSGGRQGGVTVYAFNMNVNYNCVAGRFKAYFFSKIVLISINSAHPSVTKGSRRFFVV